MHVEPAHNKCINDLKQTVTKRQETTHNATPTNSHLELQKTRDCSLLADKTKQGSSQIQLESDKSKFKDQTTMGEQAPNMVKTKAKLNSNTMRTVTSETEVRSDAASQNSVQPTKCESKIAEVIETANTAKTLEIAESVPKDKASFIKELELLEMEYEQMLEEVPSQEVPLQEVSKQTDIYAKENEEPEVATTEPSCKPFKVSEELETIAKAEEHEQEEDHKIDSRNQNNCSSRSSSGSEVKTNPNDDLIIVDLTDDSNTEELSQENDNYRALKSKKMWINDA